jgi:hypothetical protein
VGALPGTREWCREPALQYRLIVEAHGEQRPSVPILEVLMEIVVERVAGLDVHKASVTACVRVPTDAGEREERVTTFATTVPSCWRSLTGSRHTT